MSRSKSTSAAGRAAGATAGRAVCGEGGALDAEGAAPEARCGSSAVPVRANHATARTAAAPPMAPETVPVPANLPMGSLPETASLLPRWWSSPSYWQTASYGSGLAGYAYRSTQEYDAP